MKPCTLFSSPIIWPIICCSRLPCCPAGGGEGLRAVGGLPRACVHEQAQAITTTRASRHLGASQDARKCLLNASRDAESCQAVKQGGCSHWRGYGNKHATMRPTSASAVVIASTVALSGSSDRDSAGRPSSAGTLGGVRGLHHTTATSSPSLMPASPAATPSRAHGCCGTAARQASAFIVQYCLVSLLWCCMGTRR